MKTILKDFALENVIKHKSFISEEWLPTYFHKWHYRIYQTHLLKWPEDKLANYLLMIVKANNPL